MEILPQLLVNSLIAGSIYAMVALGFNLIYSTARFFDLGYGALAVVGGYGVFFLSKTLGWPLWLGIILAVLVAGLIGVIIYLLVYRKLRTRKASNLVLLVASLGVFTVIQAVIAILFSSQFQTLSTSGGSKVYQILGGVMTQVQVIILFSALAIMAILGLVLRYTTFGKAVKAVGDDEEVSKMVGIGTTKIVGWVFFIGSAIAGLAGILVGFDTGLEPTMGLSLLLKGVIASIVGGIGNVYGGVIGAFVLGLVENFGIWKISGEWKDAIAFGLLIVFLLFRPQGIFKK